MLRPRTQNDRCRLVVLKLKRPVSAYVDSSDDPVERGTDREKRGFAVHPAQHHANTGALFAHPHDGVGHEFHPSGVGLFRNIARGRTDIRSFAVDQAYWLRPSSARGGAMYALQIAIVLASANVITGAVFLMWGALGLGLLGIVFSLIGLLAPTAVHLF